MKSKWCHENPIVYQDVEILQTENWGVESDRCVDL